MYHLSDMPKHKLTTTALTDYVGTAATVTDITGSSPLRDMASLHGTAKVPRQAKVPNGRPQLAINPSE